MEKSTGPWRYRLNVSQSVKGIETSDATIEYAGDDLTWEEFLGKYAQPYQAHIRKLYPSVREGQ